MACIQFWDWKCPTVPGKVTNQTLWLANNSITLIKYLVPHQADDDKYCYQLFLQNTSTSCILQTRFRLMNMVKLPFPPKCYKINSSLSVFTLLQITLGFFILNSYIFLYMCLNKNHDTRICWYETPLSKQMRTTAPLFLQ